MSGDFTRVTFDPLDDFSRVLVQQGRVVVDADVNELADGFDHRLRALALDVLGRCTAPKETRPDGTSEAPGFRIAAAGGSFTIGAGRLYLHGLELDNHGVAPFEIEAGLQDRRGAPVPYDQQPYYPDPPAVPSGGRRVVYVDAWERERTAAEEPKLIDPAIAVDAAERVQTVWQVKVLDSDASGVTCETPDEKVPGWLEATRPSAARLSTTEVAVPAATDPCSVPPDGGYRGWDNRLYRVEVHDGGLLSEATFKWSRDNASIATVVTGIDSTRKVLAVSRTGRDDVQRIREQSWVEVIDDSDELAGRPGFLAKVKTVDKVDDMRQEVELESALPAGYDPADEDRRTRLRQWDQSEPVAEATGAVKVSKATGGLVLEDGVQVTFATSVSGGRLRTGDYWTFEARSATARVRNLTAAPPQGPRHFYGRLAIVDLPDEIVDCRTVWPPRCEGGDCGDCSVCVTPESHETGELTIQMALDRVRGDGGTVCLAPGRYELDGMLTIRDTHSVTIRGHGWSTVLVHRGPGVAVGIIDARGVNVRDLVVLTGATGTGDRMHRASHDAVDSDEKEASYASEDLDDEEMLRALSDTAERRAGSRSGAVGIAVARSIGVSIERCGVLAGDMLPALTFLGGTLVGAKRSAGAIPTDAPTAARSIAIAPGGLVIGLAVRDCALVAGYGVAPVDLFALRTAMGRSHRKEAGELSKGYLMLGALEVADCAVAGLVAGIRLHEQTLLALPCEIRSSILYGFAGPGLATAAAALSASLAVRDCAVVGRGGGIEVATPGTELEACRVTGVARVGEDPGGSGILLSEPVLEGVLKNVRVRDCVIQGERNGIELQGDHRDTVISGNRVTGGRGGVVMRDGASGIGIVVRDNVIAVTGDTQDERLPTIAGVHLVQTVSGEIHGNRVADPGAEATFANVFGIAAQDCRSVTITGNTVTGLSAGEQRGDAIGIAAWPTFDRLDIVDNVVEVSTGTIEAAQQAAYIVGIQVGAAGADEVAERATEKLVDSQPMYRMATSHEEVRAEKFMETASYIPWKDTVLRVTDSHVLEYPIPDLPTTTVRGNRVEINGLAPAVVASVDGPLLFSDNRIRHAGVERRLKVRIAQAVAGRADSLVAAANHIQSERDAFDVDVDPARAAVTGNLTSTPILIQGASLAPPWDGINAVAR